MEVEVDRSLTKERFIRWEDKKKNWDWGVDNRAEEDIRYCKGIAREIGNKSEKEENTVHGGQSKHDFQELSD